MKFAFSAKEGRQRVSRRLLRLRSHMASLGKLRPLTLRDHFSIGLESISQPYGAVGHDRSFTRGFTLSTTSALGYCQYVTTE